MTNTRTINAEFVLRPAIDGDIGVLAQMNKKLIEDEGHSNPAGPRELETRMRTWLAGAYSAAVAEIADQPVGYLLWRPDEDGIYLRQFFIDRPHRRSGLGRRAFTQAAGTLWNNEPISLEVLVNNDRGRAFWASLGFRDYSVVLRLPGST